LREVRLRKIAEEKHAWRKATSGGIGGKGGERECVAAYFSILNDRERKRERDDNA
jgi:hypothetical protein